MQILVLGSAAGGGFPQWNCNGPNSRRAREGDPKAQPRTQSSIAVTADGRHWALFNASPDLRQQFSANPQMHPREGLRDTPVSCVVLTNADVDHVAGLLTMRESQPYAIWASKRVHDVLAANSIFNVLNPEFVERRELPLGKPQPLQGPGGTPIGLTVEAFPVPGKVALWLEKLDAGPGFGTQEGDTIGVKVEQPHSGARFFYIPGCAELDQPLAKRLKGAALVLFDGTLYEDDEMIAAGLGSKTGKRMGHMSMAGRKGTIAAFAELGVGRRVFIHINNTNPVLIEGSPERRSVEAHGWEVAYDGMTLEL